MQRHRVALTALHRRYIDIASMTAGGLGRPSIISANAACTARRRYEKCVLPGLSLVARAVPSAREKRPGDLTPFSQETRPIDGFHRGFRRKAARCRRRWPRYYVIYAPYGISLACESKCRICVSIPSSKFNVHRSVRIKSYHVLSSGTAVLCTAVNRRGQSYANCHVNYVRSAGKLNPNGRQFQ